MFFCLLRLRSMLFAGFRRTSGFTPSLCFFLCFIGLAQLWPGGGGASAEHVKTSSGTPGFPGIQCAFFVDDRLFTLTARRLIGLLGTVIVSLLTNDLPFKHVYPLHIKRFPNAALVFSAAVCLLKVSRSPHDSLFSRPQPLAPRHPQDPGPPCPRVQALAGPHANSCCSAVDPRTPRPPFSSFQPVNIKESWSIRITIAVHLVTGGTKKCGEVLLFCFFFLSLIFVKAKADNLRKPSPPTLRWLFLRCERLFFYSLSFSGAVSGLRNWHFQRSCNKKSFITEGTSLLFPKSLTEFLHGWVSVCLFPFSTSRLLFWCAAPSAAPSCINSSY